MPATREDDVTGYAIDKIKILTSWKFLNLSLFDIFYKEKL